ncbi:DUF3078 domain-containing protein [Pontibacter anaerobius]|uniref:DUF3078 domain-containing protein n=1 Tax=Pontibacter anaerobius TaxID=2993940 RepID=A0ABT3RGJ9_9BACT|nr:DUF3078 domain-containing protein [Pontibacter anaerobius]MCX2740380.1 DUF3078 domain-containing protein [Pontibacter anaerobius]
MKRTLLALLALLLSSTALLAQTTTEADTLWRRSFATGLNLNQSAFSDNWKAGGISSVALNAHLDARADYELGAVSWDNAVQLQYGLIKNKGEDQRKSIDRIYLDTKYGYAFTSDWNAFVSANFLSQFAKGYEYDIDADGTDRLISNFLAPGFLTFALGAEYKPNPHFSLRLSPFAPRFTFLVDEEVGENERYGVPEGKKVRTEWLAAMVQASYDRDIMTNLNFRANYMSYINYKELSGKQIDHMLNAVLTAKVNRYINVSLMGNFVYDYDQDADIQYNQSLALGILYTVQGFSVR